MTNPSTRTRLVFVISVDVHLVTSRLLEEVRITFFFFFFSNETKKKRVVGRQQRKTVKRYYRTVVKVSLVHSTTGE